MYITAPCFEGEKYITGCKKYITGCEKYITGHRMCIRGRKKCITGCRNILTGSEKLRASWCQKLRSLKKHLMRKCTRCLTFTGGETRIRTGDKGFAGLCLTTWPSRHMKKAETNPAEKSWSGLRGSNPRPQPWQGCALPTALSPRTRGIIYANLATNASENMKFMQTFCFGCFFGRLWV